MKNKKTSGSASPCHRDARAPRASQSSAQAWVFVFATLATLADRVTGIHVWSLLSLAIISVSFIISWREISKVTLVIAAVGLVTTIGFLATGGDIEAFMLAASRALFLPALLTAMAILQAATKTSAPVMRVAGFVVEQPPGRRFGMLAFAGHLFGILLNIGGFRLLLGLAVDHCHRMSDDPRVRLIQERRILGAIIAGFGATILWSPIGVAINLIIPLVDDFDWFDYAPYGLAATIVFVGLQFCLDRLGPRPKGRTYPAKSPYVLLDILRLLALLVGIMGFSMLVDLVLAIPLQGALLIVIPSAAIIWRIAERPASGAGVGSLMRTALSSLGGPVNEICLILATGFLGLILVEVVPTQFLEAFFANFALPAVVYAIFIVVVIFGLSMVAISPMITGTLLVGAFVDANIDMPAPMLILATLTGWASSMVISPVTATVAITSAELKQPASVVGLKWNGVFVLCFAALLLAIFATWSLLL
ncbi:hypothetical protein [Chachezhania sediminis]|uniref:hypothetical protein n=1 Tax=Chachezhania sediminis TaxID=2599291 RepID=UPI00131B32EA|nr:hypothetical protein [Chachezhania sediminis]